MTETRTHTPITLLVGSEDCFERDCEEHVTEDGENDPGVERCSHITEQTVCEQCSTERPDGEYDPVVPWTGPHTDPA